MLLLPLAALTALASGVNPYLAEARDFYAQLLYAKAEARLKLAREVPNSTPEERREVYDLLARSQVALGRTADAEASYSELLAVDPDAPPPEASPKIRDLFRRAKERTYPPRFVRLS